MAVKQKTKTMLSANTAEDKEVVQVAKTGLSGAKQLHAMTATRSVEINDPRYKDVYKGVSFAGKRMIDVLNSPVHTHLDFTGCDFTGTDFTYIDNEGNTSGMVLQACKFVDCNMEGAVMAYCDVRWSDFSKAINTDKMTICDLEANGGIVGGSVLKTDGCISV